MERALGSGKRKEGNGQRKGGSRLKGKAEPSPRKERNEKRREGKKKAEGAPLGLMPLGLRETLGPSPPANMSENEGTARPAIVGFSLPSFHMIQLFFPLTL